MTDRVRGKISVITPCFNEGPSIRGNLLEISRFFRDFADHYEIICVDDGSSDGTLSELRSVASYDPNVTVLHYPKNQGKGFALRRGFQSSNGDYVVFLDADLDLHPYLLCRFFDVLEAENADVVVGSKRHPESIIDYPRRRKIISEIYYYILIALFGLPVRDTQVGLKLFKRATLESVFDRIICKRFALDVELLANINRIGYKIAEAPIKLDFKREIRWGRVGFGTLRNTLMDTLAVYYRMHILKYYDLTFLDRQSYPPIAVLVQYDDYTTEAEATLEACLRLEYANLQIIAMGTGQPTLVSDKIRHVPVAANDQRLLEGAKNSRAEVLAFIRAGSKPAPQWLENAARNLGSENIVAVSGPILSSEREDFWSDASRRVMSSITGCGGFRYRFVESLHRYLHTVTMDNLIIRRTDLLSAMEERTFFGGVETWLGAYLNRKPGHRIVYDPDVAVYHRAAPLFRPYLSGVFDWGLTRGRYLRQNPRCFLNWQDSIFLLPSGLVLLISIVLPLAFLNIFWAKAIAVLLGVYFALALLESASSLRLDMTIAVFAGIVSTHIVYGVGCMAAMLHTGLHKVKPVSLRVKKIT